MKTITTHVARHLTGDNLYFGNSVAHDLVANETYTGMMALAVTGRRVSIDERESLDDLSVILTSADPRIWPLKLVRLVSSYGGTMSGFVAGQLGLEGNQIGPWVIGYAAQMLLDLQAAVGETQDASLVEERVRTFVAQTRRFFGYGVPLRKYDERMVALEKRLRDRGRDHLPFWKLQLALSKEIARVKKLPPNVGVGVAAMFLDHGYTPKEASALPMFLHQNVFAANAVEAAGQSEEIMRRLPDEAIDYVGQPPRVSPRARMREISPDRGSPGNLAAETS